jgi:large subunit ribosomal protein L6
MRRELKLLKSQYKGLKVKMEKREIRVKGNLGESKFNYWGYLGSKSAAGSFFSFLNQECIGVTYGFYVRMYLHGIGYKVWAGRSSLLFKLGYNHLIKFRLPKSMWAYGRKSRFLLFGVKKEEVYRIAKRIVELRVPDSYKGKGVRYVNQFLKLKETKDAKKK